MRHTSYVDDVTRDDVLNTTIIKRTPDPRVWIARRDSGNRDLLEYRSAEDLRKDVAPIANYTLPYSWYGTGHVIVSGCLIYVRSRTNFLVKYDLRIQTMVRYRQLKHAKHGEPGSDNEGCPYESGHHSEITLQADEFGVWATYCSSSGSSNMMLALIDVDTLKVIKEWDTGWRKDFFEAMFVACGVVYAIRKFESRPHLQIKYAFNTISSSALKSPVSLSSSVGVDKSHGRISQLTYDHVGKQLLIWTRRGNLLTLPVNFDFYTHDSFR
ncbi:noelin-2 [Ciona intestinalis]